MRVSVRFLSTLGSLIGSRQVELSLPEKASVADLAQRLQEMYPQQAALLAQAVYMLDEKSASAQTELADGAQVLALLVLSGG